MLSRLLVVVRGTDGENSLKKNINFWFNECGLSKSEVINEVINWKNFAYTLKELEEAKNEAIRELRS
ncbi:hypothetical protein [Klebsiella pneumoniae]|uniref:hypothetical protein n=1 Tax=Klebsiella pneumoniae TaxID=573 RepID=UPI001E41FF49|nr:hypothetical protein [Klebsiella pneumoniae]